MRTFIGRVNHKSEREGLSWILCYELCARGCNYLFFVLNWNLCKGNDGLEASSNTRLHRSCIIKRANFVIRISIFKTYQLTSICFNSNNKLLVIGNYCFLKKVDLELFSKRKWTTGLDQLSNMYGMLRYACTAFFFQLDINTTAYHLGRYKLS